MQESEEAGKSLGIYQSNPQAPVLDVEEPCNTRPLWEEFAPYILPLVPQIAQAWATLLSQPLSLQCPPNLHKLDGYYCDHEQV